MISGVEDLLEAYSLGVFPMADARDDPDTYWVEPKLRGIIPLDTFNIPKSLKKFMMHCNYTVTFNHSFPKVIEACAQSPRSEGSGTWINKDIENAFNTLHEKGYAHSIEVWEGTNLIGGLYGLSQGGCFNGESMFSKKENASKIALVYLVKHLKKRGYILLDTQFINNHLKQFGCIEIPQYEYVMKLKKALHLHVAFT